jgi:hypothetical protein
MFGDRAERCQVNGRGHTDWMPGDEFSLHGSGAGRCRATASTGSTEPWLWPCATV